jgi:hypothetical protein
MKEMKWISVNIKLPCKNYYICRMNDGTVRMCYFNGKDWYEMWLSRLTRGVVEYWLPVPQYMSIKEEENLIRKEKLKKIKNIINNEKNN